MMNYCGCCGNALTDLDPYPWCLRCKPHIKLEGKVVPWERTYFAVTGTDCPYRVKQEIKPYWGKGRVS